MVEFIVFCVIVIVFIFVWMLWDEGGNNKKSSNTTQNSKNENREQYVEYAITAIENRRKRNDNQQDTQRKSPNENTVRLAVSFIETTAKFVKENLGILECDQITMWQHGNVGEGFIIEFYGYDRFVRSIIEKQLENFIGMWEIYEDPEDDVLHIRNTYVFSYIGSWNNFNKTVWDEVERKHPDWKINKPYPHKYVLHI